jgi:hypothetical protein
MQPLPLLEIRLLQSAMKWRPGAQVFRLVAPHKARVADNIRSEDRRQFALLTGHGNFLPFLQWIVECPGNCGERGSGRLWRQDKPERQAVRPIPNLARRAESSKDALKERGERDNDGGAHDRSVTSYRLLFSIL